MKSKILPIFIILLAFKYSAPALATDPHFSLQPNSGSQTGSFNIEVKVDTGGLAAGGADVYLSYPKETLRIDNFTPASGDSRPFSEVYSLIKNDEGKLRIFAYFPSTQAGKSYNGADGLIGTIRFTAVSAGQAAVTFLCTPGQTNETNIVVKTTSQDAVVCTANVGGTYTVSTSGGGTGSTSTPTPTPTSGTTGTVTPRPTIPESGVVEYTFGLLGLGILVVLTGLALSL